MKKTSLILLLPIIITVVLCSWVIDGEEKDDSIKSVLIGEQLWMSENLNVEKFRNGDLIPHVKSKRAWGKALENKEPAWCYYQNKESNGEVYGKLYNWYAVNDERGLAPEGWSVASVKDWETVINYLGGEFKASAKLKSTDLWDEIDGESGNGNNESGFNALPGGVRLGVGGFMSKGEAGAWWTSSTPGGGRNAWYRALFDNGQIIHDFDEMDVGMSVRCVKN